MTAAGAERPESLSRRVPRHDPPGPPWERYGLVSRTFLKGESSDARYSSLPRPNRFRLALEEAGGLFALFGQFLAGRADLLPRPYLRQLLTVQIRRAVPPPPATVPVSGRVSNWKLVRIAPACEMYTATYEERPIVVELYRPEANGVTEKDWNQFRAHIKSLEDATEASVTRPAVLEHFRDWLRIQGDAERKRSILGNLQDIPDYCVSRFPRPIAEWQGPASLAYERLEGDPLAAAIGPDSDTASQNLRRWAEGLLEQALLLSLIPADVQPESFLLLPDGQVGFRVVPALATVPVEWHYELLQYAVSAAAGNAHRALQMLSRMCASQNPYEAEQQLIQKLSAVQPELKINVATPPSVVELENYWRALAATAVPPPLFLELFHRNLTAVGQYDEALAAAPDVVAEALWPVMGRILRFRFGEMASTQKGREWLVSSGLLLMTTLRQTAITLEQVRDNDLALVLDRDGAGTTAPNRNRLVVSVIRASLSLAVFLFSIAVALRSGSGVLQMVAGGAALFSAVALCILVARIR